MMNRKIEDRRKFLRNASNLSLVAFAGLPTTDLVGKSNPTDEPTRPNLIHGIASGDVGAGKGILWSKTDRPSRMIVELSADEQFRKPRRISGPNALVNGDFTCKLQFHQWTRSREVFYRVQFESLENGKRSPSQVGRLKLPPMGDSKIRFGWSGDTAGQGFGINLDDGGMKSYATILNQDPDFFIHCGDVCYSDGPIESTTKLPDGSIWKNLVTEGKSKVAETLEEFRAQFRYNLLDDNVRKLNASISTLYQWDDHETTNNWYPGEMLDGDRRYQVKSASLLAARGRQAFFEYLPIRNHLRQQIHRQIAYGPNLDLFFLDARSFRGPNSSNRQQKRSGASAFFGNSQLQWLKSALKKSTATWKFICNDMPIGLVVTDGDKFENCANGDGPALGRELEIANLLAFIKENQIRNVVFLTADVHYAASHHYSPERAQFQDFDPFWEFVSGPLHAGTFGPGTLDNTFGPEVKFCSIPQGMPQNRPPSDGYQFFGMVEIEGQNAKVQHFNRDGELLKQHDLQAV